MRRQENNLYEFEGYRLDAGKRVLMRDGSLVPLSPKAVDLLIALVENSGQVLKKDELMRQVWPDSFVEEANLSHHIFTLRKALGESENGAKYIETVPRRGYRFIASVAEVHDESDALVVAEHSRSHIVIEQVEAPHLSIESSESVPTLFLASTNKRRWVIAVACLVIALVLAVAGYLWKMGNRSQPISPGINSIAVLPFKPLVGAQRNEALELGMADTLIAKLSGIRQLIVRPVSAIRNYTALDQDPIAAGRALDVDYVVEGNLLSEGDKVRATVRLLRVKDGLAIWTDQCDQQCTSIFDFQDAVAQHLAGEIGHHLSGDERKHLAKHYTENAEAYRLYVQGRFFWNKRSEEGFKKGIEFFTQALKLDPSYALAYSGLADCYALLANSSRLAPNEGFPKAKAAAMKALQLDDSLAEAHTSLAFVSYLFDTDFERAEIEFKRALELNPNYATAHQWYADYLSTAGRDEAALLEAQLAQQNDPLSLVINAELADYHRRLGQYDKALEQLRKTREMDPDFIRTHQSLGRVYLHTGAYEQAIAEFQRARQLDDNPRNMSALGHAYALAGKKAEARQIIEELKSLSKRHYVAASLVAVIYAGLGEIDDAFYWLDKAYEQNENLNLLTSDEDFAPLRADPRFQRNIHRFGFRAPNK